VAHVCMCAEGQNVYTVVCGRHRQAWRTGRKVIENPCGQNGSNGRKRQGRQAGVCNAGGNGRQCRYVLWQAVAGSRRQQ